MKKLLLCLTGLFALSYISWSQCTPVDCSSSLPAYGGVCDTLLMDGTVNQPYTDSESFVLTDNCFDAGLIDPSQAGNNIRITNVDNFTFGGLPNGISVVTNQSSYSPPSGGYIVGCALFSGTPTEAGLFYDTMYFLADVQLCGFFPINIDDNPANYVIWMTIYPDPSFTGLASTYCEADAPATLTATGTTGGTFSGPGVTGNTFDPSSAGVGTHTIWYVVSAQEGLAVAPATDSSSMTVTVTSGTTYYVDADVDNYGDVSDPGASFCANPGAGYSTDNTDCNDGNSAINPGATEVCDGVDNNCDGLVDEGLPLTTYYVDSDGDNYGDINDTGASFCANPGPGYVTNNTDCDDIDPNNFPGNVEVCDGQDNNCNTLVDEGLSFTTYYADVDSDNYGDMNDAGTSFCANPGAGYVTNNTDCNDVNSLINPGATEVCDGQDNNCDGLVDEGLPLTTYYVDNDGDSYGDINDTGNSLCANPGPGYVTNNTDCNDGDIAINPGATEVCDGVDNDCNTLIDDGLTFTNYYVDGDGDGYGAGAAQSLCQNPGIGFSTNNTDCNDADGAINPGATEVCDGVDNNCNLLIDDGLTFTTYYVDNDGDSYGDINDTGNSLCANPGAGYVTNNTDCNDGNSAINPGATEVCDGVDNNCNTLIDDGLPFTNYYLDGDGDGFGAGAAQSLCQNPGAGYSLLDTDCNDGNNSIYPGAPELCDSLDNDCNTLIDDNITFTDYYVDGDGDGFGAGTAQSFCQNPGAGYSLLDTDCNDGDNSIYPGASEICDGVDNDCNTLIDDGLTFTDYYVDGDGDGYGDENDPGTSLCADPGAGYSMTNDDCDDTDNTVYPGATEIIGNGIDENCDGVDGYLDMKEDGFSPFVLFPNPSSSIVTIKGEKFDRVKISDLAGKRVMEFRSVNNTELHFDVETLINGVYLVHIKSEAKVETIKFIKQ